MADNDLFMNLKSLNNSILYETISYTLIRRVVGDLQSPQ